MQVAIDKDGKRVFAYNAKMGDEYLCPICRGSVILRKGSINVDHFAHRASECIDNWHYDMSEWHYSLQKRFSKEEREVVVKHMGEIHRADILQGNQIIEFQHSPISIEEINKRNKFYNAAGYSVAWVFDVQEQYDSKAIKIIEYDRAEYKWSNPKRCLQCFPQPKEYNKKLVIYLYWVDEDGYECFNRVIWSTSNLGHPDFKRFIASEYVLGSNNSEVSLSVGDFFLTKDDLLENRLSELKCRYVIKYTGIKGHPRDTYVCSKTNIYITKFFHVNGCKHCRFCAAIKKLPKGFKSYCCYPNQVNEITEAYEGYECSGIPIF